MLEGLSLLFMEVDAFMYVLLFCLGCRREGHWGLTALFERILTKMFLTGQGLPSRPERVLILI